MSTTNAAPAALGKYQIRGVLGRGAMGTVYDGWDPAIGRRVAIKTVRRLDNDDPEAQEALLRFKNEAQAAGRLSHPNIVAVYDYGESDEVAFIVMEFVEGQSLKQRLDAKECFPVAETVRIMEQVLTGLQFSHDRGVIHRDIKPGNVMMTRDGQVKLADFGIARIESSVMTQAGTMLGTPAYMSPEQLMGQTVDARSDIYSSGVLLYQLLTGERPFEGGLQAIRHKALNTVALRPSDISVTAPPSLDPIVARAMARRPADRYPNAAAFANAMREAFETSDIGLPALGPDLDDEATRFVPSPRPVVEPEAAPPPPPPRLLARPARRLSPMALGAAAAVLLGLIGGGGWFALRPSPPEKLAAVAVPPPNPHSATEAETHLPQAPPPDTLPQAETLNPPPEHVVMAQPNSAAIREALRPLTASAHCALPRFAVSEDGQVQVSGEVGVGAPDAALHDAVQNAAPGVSPTWTIRGIDGPYCDVFDTIRPLAQPGSPFLGLALKDDVTRLQAHKFILPAVNLPEFPAYLQVDYFSHDSSVTHLFPLRGTPNLPFSANATVRLGLDPHGKPNLEVGPPFGIDVIVATASSSPLFPGHVRGDETQQTYLPVLKAAVEAAQRRNAKLAGRVLVLETVER